MPRLTWHRYFDFDTYCPSGHAASEITGKQGTIAKLAENYSGNVTEPSLTGYTFLGFTDSGGNAYASEKMLSDKTFYAKWRKNKYRVQYDGNGSQNPDHEEGEFTQNVVSGEMEDSEYEYDTKGQLRANAYAREGYTFTGWNTKPDGTGNSYPDGFDSVLNWTGTDGGIVTLYAQWKKKLGTETITVVSEETGNAVKGVSMKLQKSVNGVWTDVTSGTTDAQGKITQGSLHWFNYRWVMTGVPAGYVKSADTEFRITYDGLLAENSVILYMKHASITLDSRVSEVIKGENAPAFLYHVSGTDVAGVRHEYDVLVQTDSSTKSGSNSVPDVFAGTYTVTQTPVSRYAAGNAEVVENAAASGVNATVDVIDNSHAEARFPYTVSEMGWLGSMASKTNHLSK